MSRLCAHCGLPTLPDAPKGGRKPKLCPACSRLGPRKPAPQGHGCGVTFELWDEDRRCGSTVKVHTVPIGAPKSMRVCQCAAKRWDGWGWVPNGGPKASRSR